MSAGKLNIADAKQLRLADAALAPAADAVWPRHRRVIFALAAGAVCWAVPLLILYFFAT